MNDLRGGPGDPRAPARGEGGEAPGSAPVWKLLWKALAWVGLAMLGAALSEFAGVREWFEPSGRAAVWLREMGPVAWPVYLGVTAGCILAGIPRLLFCPVAGALFGFWGGMAASAVATMAAYWVAFLIARGRSAMSADMEKLPAGLSFLKTDPGLAGVILVRLLPMPGLVGTAILGMSRVRLGTYLLGSLFGLIPESAPLVLLGAGLAGGHSRELAWAAAGALALVVIACLWTWRWMNRGATAD